ncbi:MAG: HAD-IIA family hydrolase [Beutenbergiaceae bacterium]
MSDYLTELPLPPIASYDAALLDLDGVVYRGPAAVPYAADAIAAAAAAGMGLMYVTNNANRPPSTVADHLTELGISTAAQAVTTAAQAAARLIASEYPAGTPVLVVGGAGLREALTEEGMRVVGSADDQPLVVVQGLAHDVGWPQLTEAVLAISRGAEHIASNLDATLPLERGPALGNGSLVAAVVNATGRKPRSTGKPQPEIFHQAAARLGASNPVVIGDRLDTDLAGARAAGYPGMQVLTGVDDATALLRCVAQQRPTLIALDLRGMLEPHPAVSPADDWWRCGEAAARHRDGTIELSDGVTTSLLASGMSIDIDQLRAACVAAWAASDQAGEPTVLDDAPADLSVLGRDPGSR